MAELAKYANYVGRYYCSTDSRKVLTHGEAAAMTKAGMRILVFFQNGARTRRSFGAALGERNGAVAWNQAVAASEPDGGAIYFCVDYDAMPADINGYILPCFVHLTNGMETARAAWMHARRTQRAPCYCVGIYATPQVIDGILADPTRTISPRPFIFLALPPIWQRTGDPGEYARYLTAQQWSVWQIGVGAICHRVGRPLDGFPCDFDEVRTSDNGSFLVK